MSLAFCSAVPTECGSSRFYSRHLTLSYSYRDMFPSFPKALASCLLSSLCILPAIAIPVNALITTALSGTELAPFDHSLGSGLLTHLPPPQRGVLAGRTETPGGLFGANGVPDIADLDQSKPPCLPDSFVNAADVQQPSRIVVSLLRSAHWWGSTQNGSPTCSSSRATLVPPPLPRSSSCAV